jgi:hypothetical protein
MTMAAGCRENEAAQHELDYWKKGNNHDLVLMGSIGMEGKKSKIPFR